MYSSVVYSSKMDINIMNLISGCWLMVSCNICFIIAYINSFFFAEVTVNELSTLSYTLYAHNSLGYIRLVVNFLKIKHCTNPFQIKYAQFKLIHLIV